MLCELLLNRGAGSIFGMAVQDNLLTVAGKITIKNSVAGLPLIGELIVIFQRQILDLSSGKEEDQFHNCQ
jgi:hypothetical protein